MALINCPECSREISDKVQACPHCGYPVRSASVSNEEQPVQKVEISSVNIKPKKPGQIKKVGLIIGSILIFIALAFGVYSIIRNNILKKEYNAYIDNVNLVLAAMLSGGADSEEILNDTAQVWYNAIWKEKDASTDKYTRPNGIFVEGFNTALGLYFADTPYVSTVSRIEHNQSTVSDLMKELQNPPKGLESLYTSLKGLYSTYQGLTDLAINPHGSYQTFTDSKNEKIDKFLELYKGIQIQIPEKK